MKLVELAFQFAKGAMLQNWSEVEGSASNPNITECYKSVDGLGNPEVIDDSEVPWCSCFVNYCVQKAGGRGTRSAMARSWLQWGKASSGAQGDIVVLRRGTSSVSGHVGFVVSKSLFSVQVLGGNQDDTVCIKSFPRVMVLGYRTSRD